MVTLLVHPPAVRVAGAAWGLEPSSPGRARERCTQTRTPAGLPPVTLHGTGRGAGLSPHRFITQPSGDGFGLLTDLASPAIMSTSSIGSTGLGMCSW